MKDILGENGEIALLVDNVAKITAFENLPQWQQDQLLLPFVDGEVVSYASQCLMEVDYATNEWIASLSKEEVDKVLRQKSLFGIPIPKTQIKLWRIILKEPSLRDSEGATRNGMSIGSYAHLWNIWTEECINKYLTPIEKEVLRLVDAGYPYLEIGEIMVTKYGSAFWQKRKPDAKTTPAQIVSYYLYLKMPTKIARQELTNTIIKTFEKKKERVAK